ncbi:uncharacterized protein ARMOST_09919 [Armillaria ostoyae]|uniref:Fungal-type protein kinase domain-containing protein n=1 Tax=Armillaria ostoyae TaxID=47428 RepID=A0A284RCU8_ARMOS|nr:uncharacterized protein ARMOST_09919 [Armillaria ostoyae]
MPKTPPKGTSEGLKLQQSRGTASNAPFNQDRRVCRLDNIRVGGIDLEDTQTVEFVSLLKALLARMLLGVSTDGKFVSRNGGSYEVFDPSLKVGMPRENTVALDRAKSDANQLFDKMLKDAIGFCNSSLTTSAKTSLRSKLSQEMKTNLKEFFRRNSETRRYLLSIAINTIMLAYDGYHFGQLPCLSGNDRIIVIPNDPLVIESKKIKRDLPNAKRKPDDIFIQLSHLLKLEDRCEDFDYRDWVQSIETECKESKRVRKDADEKTSWLEVHCSLESEARRVIECAPLDQIMSEKQVLGGSTFLVQLPILISFNDSKSESDRRLTSQASGSSTGAASEKKRSHPEAVGSEYASETTSSQKKRKTSDFDELFTAETQCAYYAIERLRAAWNVTHSIVLLLDGYNMLSIHWYDSEGCIVTQSVDIIGQLPLFVVLVIILQRFDAAMWGLPDIQTSQMTENGRVSFEVDKTKRSRFQLAGRRTFGACAWSSRADDAKITPPPLVSVPSAATSPVLDGSEQSIAPQGLYDTSSNSPITTSTLPCPGSMPTLPMRRRSSRLNEPNTPQNTSSLPVPHQGSRAFPGSTREPQSLFFKAARPENSRDREPDIIAEAISRENRYLGEFKTYVLEHIPTVVNWQKVIHTPTAIIRQLLGLSAERLRTLLWMVCHKLDPIEDLHKLPNDLKAQAFWKAFWELIRCHYLLWRIGIAHGDISIGNLMHNAVTKKAILNDFDLAAVMKPGDISPQKKGFERTGTIPFMALELLDKADGEVRWRYRHDLESFAWCLLWCAMAEEFPKMAKYGSITDVCDSKAGLAFGLRWRTTKSGFKPIWKCVVEWVDALVVRPSKDEDLRKLVEHFIALGGQIPSDNPLTRVLRSKDEDEDGKNLVKELIAFAHEHGLEIPLDDLEWVDFQIPLQASSSSTDANVGDVTA